MALHPSQITNWTGPLMIQSFGSLPGLTFPVEELTMRSEPMATLMAGKILIVPLDTNTVNPSYNEPAYSESGIPHYSELNTLSNLKTPIIFVIPLL